MTEPDEPKIQRWSVFALATMLLLLLLVVALERGFERAVRQQVAESQWNMPWEHLEERRLRDELVLTTAQCEPDGTLCRIPIEDAMHLLVREPDRLSPWSTSVPLKGETP